MEQQLLVIELALHPAQHHVADRPLVPQPQHLAALNREQLALFTGLSYPEPRAASHLLASGVALSTFLFDLDGTLIDSIELILRSYRHTMRTHRGEEPPDDVWMSGLGTPLWVQFRRFTDDAAEIEAMVATYRDYNLAHHDEMVRPYDGVVAGVRQLQSRGGRLGLVTSKLRRGAIRGLERAGLEDAFAVIVGADDVTHPKPHPEPVLLALERLSAPAASAVFIGDSRHDLECGRAAGVRTAAVLWGPFDRAQLEDLAPDYWLVRPQDLSLLTTDD